MNGYLSLPPWNLRILTIGFPTRLLSQADPHCEAEFKSNIVSGGHIAHGVTHNAQRRKPDNTVSDIGFFQRKI